jgi:hypothetical protein
MCAEGGAALGPGDPGKSLAELLAEKRTPENLPLQPAQYFAKSLLGE